MMMILYRVEPQVENISKSLKPYGIALHTLNRIGQSLQSWVHIGFHQR